ncbi:MAG: response regulator [Bacteroidota bacterium]
MGLFNETASWAMATERTNQQARILLVDDEPNILAALKFLMNQAGYDVATANSGAAALSMVDQFQPDVVVLDVMMPGVDGFEVAKQIRENTNLLDTQIIFLTAKGTTEDRRQGFKSGGELYLTKPFDNADVVDSVAYALQF